MNTLKLLLIGLALGLILSSVQVLAFHYFGHDPNVEQQNQFNQQWQNFQQQQERMQQEMFRNQQRANPC